MKTIEGYEGGCRWWFRTTSDKSEYKHNWQTREVLVMDLDFDILSHFCRHIKRMRDIKWRERERERQLRGLRNQRNSFHKSLEDKTLSLRNTHSSTREIIMSASHDWVNEWRHSIVIVLLFDNHGDDVASHSPSFRWQYSVRMKDWMTDALDVKTQSDTHRLVDVIKSNEEIECIREGRHTWGIHEAYGNMATRTYETHTVKKSRR